MRNKSIYENIRFILNEFWDPIGVNHEVEDEYDQYIPFIHQMLQKRATIDEISSYLIFIEDSQMGLIPNELRAKNVAAYLLESFTTKI